MNRSTRKTLLASGHAVIYRDADGIERVLVYADKESAEAFSQYHKTARVVSHVQVLGLLRPGQTE